ncbi:molybdopterin-binding oxidoreductase [Halonotius terrestris]|uniref:Molybdopterin-binding oxidoreductase n=1 Tax=Halonotius terrestris TaxID=2487750 RepID=A0A8J8PE62_9EURY|nr:molybdopterin-dependent oxidoreductase [Halonotius terrestris]TQQ83655.1 molybdopterin-binding oxidoreductase [Halonotius terrestris]
MIDRIRDTEYVTVTELLFAVLAGATGVAGSYAVAGYTRQFIVAPIDAQVVRLTPGSIVAFFITNIGEEGHLLHIALSFCLAAGLLGAIALLGMRVADRLTQSTLGIALAGGLAWGVTAAITGDPVLAIGAGAPVLIFTAIAVAPTADTDHNPARRRAIASALAFVGVAAGIGRLTSEEPTQSTEADVSSEVEQQLQQAESQQLDITGDVPGLVSEIGEFYNVDIAEFDPEVPSDDWSMTITGEVGEDVTVSYDELTSRETEHRYVTLRCVGEDLNGEKLDNAVWTGTPIKPLLDEADPEGECDCAMLRAEDDYFVQFPVEALEDAFLAWEMNGQPLPQSHGHPVRVLVPGHWGETNVKWLSEIELLDEEMDGYWEQRGWHGTGPVNTIAKLWSTTMLDGGTLELAGHAYAGTRGIERVEVSTDGGSTWQDAELSEPLPGDDVWRQWRYEFTPDGSHDVVVRAVDGEGTLQPEERSDSYPSGATGWVRKTVNMMDASG